MRKDILGFKIRYVGKGRGQHWNKFGCRHFNFKIRYVEVVKEN